MKLWVYRLSAVMSLICVIYLGIRAAMEDKFDSSLVLPICAMGIFVLLGFMERKSREELIYRQTNELKMYQMYVKPLEEMVKEIRARQHEFDNHMNAILNMHLTIDNYDELVEQQTEYGGLLYAENRRKFFSLLRISDKVLAGFLYSKIVNAPDSVELEVQVLNQILISRVPESDIIEIVGSLLDNAIEACKSEQNKVYLSLDSKNDKLIFEIQNQVEHMTVAETQRFFEKGYSTKQSNGKRGLGLYNAKRIVQRVNGSMEVSIEQKEEGYFVCFRLEL